MIDFKYHVVSIVAVFLALAVGIVLGTNVLSGDVLDNLKSQTNDLRKQAQDLRAQNEQAQNQISRDQGFVGALEPMAVAGALTGRSVVVISVPNAPKDLRGQVVKTLTDAGATVTGQVDIDGSYADPANVSALADLLATLELPPDDPTPAGDVAARAGKAVAFALVAAPTTAIETGDITPEQPTAPASGTPASGTPASGTPAQPTSKSTEKSTASASTKGKAPATPKATGASKSTPAATTTPTPGRSPVNSVADVARLSPASMSVLAGLAKAGFVKVDQQPTGYAAMAVVIGAPASAQPTDATPTPAAQHPLLDLVAALKGAGAQTVVVGPAKADDTGGLVALLRGDATLAKSVSGVDDADTPSGLIAMVFALRAQAGGSVGQYGSGPGAQQPLATALPTVSATAATSS